MARRALTVEGERETIRALEDAAAVASEPATLAAALELALDDARSLAPNDTGELAGSYSILGDPPGIVSPLVHAGIVEYGWPARGRPAYRRVHAAAEARMVDMERVIDERVTAAGDRLGL